MLEEELTLNIEDLCINCVPIPPGSFIMGSDNGLELEGPVHPVTIKHPFYFSRYLVTQSLWDKVMHTNPSTFKGNSQLPVDNISWLDAQQFCQTLSEQLARKVRLPNEAEWEYACRGGTDSEYFFADSAQQVAEYAWYEDNSREQTHAVAGKQPNPWLLYGIVGNLWAWCEDIWCSDYHDAPTEGSANTRRSTQQPQRVLRGGAWNMDSFRCRRAYRNYEWNELVTDRFGVRFVIEME